MTAFFDSNILLYMLDKDSREKRGTALRLFEQYASEGTLVLSVQVLGEVFNVLTKKWKMPKPEASAQIASFAQFPVIAVEETLVTLAMERSHRSMIGYYDALIVEAARRGDAGVLYSEDMQHGMNFDGVRLINPFL